jgi:hypothetical protein
MKLMIINRPELTAMLMAALLSLFSCSKKEDNKETGPVITGFSSDTVWIGKTITINGSGFSATTAENSIRIGNLTIKDIIESSATSLTIKVPAGATSAKVFVTVNGKEISSSGELIVSNQMAWQKALGGFRDDDGVAVAATANGGYLLAGHTESSGDGDVGINHGISDLWVVKLNADRSIAWQKVFGGSNTDEASSIVALADGSCVVAGTTTSTDGDVTGNHGGSDFFIIKLDAGGNVLWKRVLGGSGSELANAVIATPNGYVVAGYSSSNDGDVSGNHGVNDYWIVWLDANGALIRQKSYGGYDYDQANAITATADGGYLVAGGAMSNDGDVTGHHGAYDNWVLKLNAAGSIEWQKALGGTGTEKARSIIAASDGSSYIAGSTSSTNGDVTGNHGSDDYWVVKLNANGKIAWQKALGGSLIDQAFAITLSKDGGCAVAGMTTSVDGDITANHGKSESWIVRLNATGSLVWQKSLGGTNSELSFGLVATGNSFTVIGRSNSYDGDVSGLHGTTRSDFWLFNILD